jgi:hypothetical protein
MRQTRGKARDRHVNAARDDFRDRRRYAAEWNVQRLGAGEVQQQLHREMC